MESENKAKQQAKMLGPKNIARRLDLSLSQVYRLLKDPDGPIPHFKINSSYKIPEDKFEEWLNEHWTG